MNIWIGLLLAAVTLQAQGAELNERLDKILKGSRIKREELGAIVALHRNGETKKLWAVRETDSMMPASLTKIITAAAVLDGMGPSRKLETRLYSSAPIAKGELSGDLILQGGGDPSFVSESMWFLVNELTRTGLQKIKGNIIVDDSRFDRVRTDESRQSERVDRAFDAPIGAMSFNWNSVNVYVRPAATAGEPASVYLDPVNDFVKLRGTVRTVKAGEKSAVQVSRETDNGRDVIVVGGKIALGANEFVAYKNISAPELWSGHCLVSFLKQRGITVAGTVKSGVVPAAAIQVARVESKPIALLVQDMMKFSNNFVAEMLVKILAAEKKGVPATMASGMDMVHRYITGLNIPQSRWTIVNPSGFSRENKISPSDLHGVLSGLREHFQIFPEALASFPVAGVDGTLKSRMRGTPAEGRVRAKTGLLTGVAGLGGFAGRSDGTQVSFVFMFNGRPTLSEDARALFDRMAGELVQ